MTYLFGGRSERRNLEVVRSICTILDDVRPAGAPHERLIHFVPDRPGHDYRYAIDASLAERELGWSPRLTFEEGLRRTVQWYLDNDAWLERARSGRYLGERLGLASTR